MSATCIERDLWGELWVSLSSLLRSYTAVHSLGRGLQATVALDEDCIVVRHGTRSLELERCGSRIAWKRESGAAGKFEFTEAGRLKSQAGEEEMDMAAEAWARELMQ